MTLIGFAARNLLRNKLRTGLTILGVAVAMLTFLLLRTLLSAWTVGADYAARDRVVTRHKVTFVMSLPKRYMDDVTAIPGVRTATFANWFGGKDPSHPNDFFATLAVDPKTFLTVYDELEVPSDALATWQTNRTGALVGDQLAKKFGWKVGDRVSLESGIFPSPPDKAWTFTIDGIYTTSSKFVDRMSFYFHWDYMNESLPEVRKDEIGWIISRVDDPKRAADIGLTIDRAFESKDTQTLSQDERSFNTSFLAGISAVLSAINIVSLAILVIMMLVLGNTVAMGVRERTNEYGVLRAVGFEPKHIVLFILGESMFTGVLGGLVGIAFGYPVINQGLGRWLEENMGQFFPYFRMGMGDLALAAAIAMALGAGAAILPARGAARLRVTDALRRVA